MRWNKLLLIRICALLALIMLFLYPTALPNQKSIKTSISDKDIIAATTLMDKSLIKYYRNHSELPSDINEETLQQMGLLQYKDNKFWTYEKSSNNSYILTVKLSNNTYESAYSNKILPNLYENITINGEI